MCQCVLSLRAVNGTQAGPYPFEERLTMQLEAIRLTIPWFDLDHIGLGPYSAEELRLIMQIGSTCAEAQQYEKAMRIYTAGLEYLEANGQYSFHDTATRKKDRAYVVGELARVRQECLRNAEM